MSNKRDIDKTISATSTTENNTLPKKKSKSVKNRNSSSKLSEDNDLLSLGSSDDLFAELGGKSLHNPESGHDKSGHNNDDAFLDVAHLCGKNDESGPVNRQHSLETPELSCSLLTSQQNYDVHRYHHAKIRELQDKVSGLESTVSGLESTVSGLESTVSGLESTVSGLESTVSKLDSELSQLRDFVFRHMSNSTQIQPSNISQTGFSSSSEHPYFDQSGYQCDSGDSGEISPGTASQIVYALCDNDN